MTKFVFRLFDLIIHLRGMTTEYLEAILNSPMHKTAGDRPTVANSSNKPSTPSEATEADTRTLAGTVSAQSISSALVCERNQLQPGILPDSAGSVQPRSLAGPGLGTVSNSVHEAQHQPPPSCPNVYASPSSGSTAASTSKSGTLPTPRKNQGPFEGPLAVSSLVAPVKSTLTTSHVASPRVAPAVSTAAETFLSARPKFSSLEIPSRLSLPGMRPFQPPDQLHGRGDDVINQRFLSPQPGFINSANAIYNATHLPRPEATYSQAGPFRQGLPQPADSILGTESNREQRSSASQEVQEIASRIAAHHAQLQPGSFRHDFMDISLQATTPRVPYFVQRPQISLIGGGPSQIHHHPSGFLPTNHPQMTKITNTPVIPKPGSMQPVSFINLLRSENDSTSEILRSDYQLAKSGLGPEAGSKKQQHKVSSQSRETQRDDFGFPIARTGFSGYRKSTDEIGCDSESPPKRQKSEPDLVTLTCAPAGSYLNKSPLKDNGTVDTSARWAALLEEKQGKLTKVDDNDTARISAGSILEAQLRKGIEKVSMSYVPDSYAPVVGSDPRIPFGSPTDHSIDARLNSSNIPSPSVAEKISFSNTTSENKNPTSGPSLPQDQPNDRDDRHQKDHVTSTTVDVITTNVEMANPRFESGKDENLRRLLSSPCGAPGWSKVGEKGGNHNDAEHFNCT